jgi:hypothetical protein
MTTPRTQATIGRWLAISASVVVAITIVTAIVVMGSPAAQRLQKLDAKRVQQLQTINDAIDSFVDTHEALPASLAALDGAGRWLDVTDPEDGAPYGYETTGARTFRLCAVFATKTTASNDDNVGISRNWGHGEGRQCFERKAKSAKE